VFSAQLPTKVENMAGRHGENMGKDTWLKLHTSILTSRKFISLPHNDHRQAFFILLLLAKKGLESAPESYFLGHLNLSKRRWKTVKSDLVKYGLLDGNGTVNGFIESQLTPDAHRKREQRQRENVTDKTPDKSQDIPQDSRMQSAECRKQNKEKNKNSPPGKRTDALVVLGFLNKTTGRNFSNSKNIEACLKREKCTVGDCQAVIRFKWGEWAGTDMAKHMNPTTPFRSVHFQNYLDESKAGPVSAGKKQRGFDGPDNRTERNIEAMNQVLQEFDDAKDNQSIDGDGSNSQRTNEPGAAVRVFDDPKRLS